MQQGTVISATGHAALIALAIFGMPERARDMEPARAQVSDVSIVSLEAFEAARSNAPEEATEPEADLQAPVADAQPSDTPTRETMPIVPLAAVPDAPSTESAPDMSGLEVAQPSVSTEVDTPVSNEDAGQIGLDTPLIDAAPQDGSVNSTQTALLVPEHPNQAPRIDTTAAPKPAEPVKEAPDVQEETAPDVAAEATPKEPQEAAAPKEATTETVPDAEPEERPTTPVAATRPKGRPANLRAEAEKRKKAEEEAIAAASAPVQAETPKPAAEKVAETPRGSRLGNDFNSSQRQAVGDAISGVWNKQLIEGKQGFEDLVVIVRVRLTAAGRIVGAVEPVQPVSPQGDFKVAYEAARRAILRAQPIPLPQDVFRDGDYLEIRFDPGRSAISLN